MAGAVDTLSGIRFRRHVPSVWSRRLSGRIGQTLRMRGVLLDVGGVFLVPSRARLVPEIGHLTGGLSDAEFDRAHFEGIHAIDAANVPGHEDHDDRRIYLNGYLSSLGIPESELETATDALDPIWRGSSTDLWRRILIGSIAGLRNLHDADLRLGIVSNSDGHVEEELTRNEICQVGAGRGVPVLTVVDSGVVGVAKPDPSIFDFAIPALGGDPSELLYVGDSVKYDVRSAEAAGMTPLHLDPFGLCQATDHAHVGDVSEVLAHV
jgi:putative hydrolase of the HAD superfamily